jgi:hypothetical protein
LAVRFEGYNDKHPRKDRRLGDMVTTANGRSWVDGLLGLSFLGNFKVSLNNGVLELAPLE